jgi:DNA-binding NtrC family response regulator
MRKVDVRVLAASNVDVRSAVDAGEFREDLFYRLNVVTAEVPPLRSRRDDIPLLVNHFLEKSCRRLGRSIEGVTEDAMRFLVSAPWRGNVRELENCVEKAVILADTDRIDAAFLASILPDAAHPTGQEDAVARKDVVVQPPTTAPAAPGEAADLPTLGEFDTERLAAEKRYLERLVEAAGGNLAEAARRAGVKNRNTLISRLKKHGLGRKSQA